MLLFSRLFLINEKYNRIHLNAYYIIFNTQRLLFLNHQHDQILAVVKGFCHLIDPLYIFSK